MKNIKFLLLALLLAFTGMLKAQDEMTLDQMIPVRVLMPINDDIKGDALTVLYNRLNQAVTLNGLGSTTNESRFLIVSSVTVLSKNVTTSIPPQHVAEVEVALYFVDNVNKVILSQEIINKNGMADNDVAALSKAIKSIPARDRKLKKLITVGKKRAMEYYQALGETETEEGNETPDVSWIFE
ncbi:MAG: hypothetical protein J6X10_01630 [Bacteroidales bacterium]|nr:hypothetical protein [Bacteroidales bacterium]